MKPNPTPAEEEEQRRLILRLIEVNNPRRQLFDGIWWFDKVLQIKRHAAAPIEPLAWTEVREMIAKAEAEQLPKKRQGPARLPKGRRNAR